MPIDFSGDFGGRVARRLAEEQIGWLTTVTPSGAPVPSPVWFLWDGAESAIVFSLNDAPRLRNIQANPRVALSFDGDGNGGDIVVLSGEAAPDHDAPAADAMPEYVAKYAAGLERLGLTAEEFAARYSVPVRIRFTRLRGH
jgi:PPOX class probable F420-dependent enzyme